MKFIRTVSTRRLLAVIAGIVAAIAAGTAIAVAAAGNGPVPPPKPLASSLHNALTAPSVDGVSADITFTNNLIGSTDFTGDASDPILQGAGGRLWVSADGRLRLELQSSDGDAQVVVDNNSFWVSDPSANTVYEGTLPAHKASSAAAGASGSAGHAIPSVDAIQSDLNKLMAHVNLIGADHSNPTDVAGQAAYSVSISPRHDGGLLGSAELAWDAATGVPLNVAIYAKGNSTPVLELKADDITYGPVSPSAFDVTPPAGAKVVQISSADENPTAPLAAAKHAGHARHADVTGVVAVASHLSFSFDPPGSLVGLPRHAVSLLSWGGEPAALVTYGRGLGGIVVIERGAQGQRSPTGSASSQTGTGSGLSLPTVSINGATGQELDTALGTVVSFSSGGVSYTVLGSVPPVAAEHAARALTP
jgi:outer membrane lipoprotein-sorting protein